MKLSFEGRTIHDIVHQMEAMLAQISLRKATADIAASTASTAPPDFFAPSVSAVDKPVNKPVEKKARTEKQLANDEKMRVAALERVAAKRAAKAAPVEKPVEKPVEELPDPIGKEPEIDPAELVKIRLKTIEELQAAYANGHQKEVFELLSRFGNGAKSFRELPPESFAPIRRAIDLGALE